ncbi:hypothetical protein EWM62_07410 [Mucilaginibacter terrigena]|uniref:Lipocalin-like domain-containing protein n=1 Tax=Mucilaginibacter terrigena TaxID=2492395 RepID=A0A4Q5LLN1_9SPHI|nr:hypothetical protein [Mucilaginibacter terrigena]RYU90477.1 hypothetical protein EWM62_07410 [Mucilaginibacter terrigena]
MKAKHSFKIAILAGFFLMAGGRVALAQCDKTATLTASATSYLDAQGTIIKTVDAGAVISITKTDLTITPDSDHAMSGKITSATCDWKVPFKEGKTVVKAVMSKDGTDEKHVTVTIDGKDGKVALTFEAEEMPGKKIQVVADKFE